MIAPNAIATHLPSQLRTASSGAQQEYRAAQAFERVLLGQLAKAMQATVPGEEDGAGAATQSYRQMLPDTMADALGAGGGIGLASELVRSLRTQTPPS